MDYDEEILHLEKLYSKFENNCEIISYHGNTDYLVSHLEKRKLNELIKNFAYHEIGNKEVDGNIFHSTNHGLDADFLKFFGKVIYEIKGSAFERVTFQESVHFETEKNTYEISYAELMPILKINKK